jgi:hypothetical protein
MIVVFGGLATRGTNQEAFVNDVHVWALRGASRWVGLRTIEGRAPMPRCYHCAAAVGSKLIVFGGNAADESFSDLAFLECTPTVSAPDTWSWHWPRVVGTGPRARTGATATAIGDRFVLVVGGWDPHEDRGGRGSHRPAARPAAARGGAGGGAGAKRGADAAAPSAPADGGGAAHPAARLAAVVAAGVRTGEDEPEPFPEAWLLDTASWTWMRIAGDVGVAAGAGGGAGAAPSPAAIAALKSAAGRVGHAATLLPDARALLRRAAALGSADARVLADAPAPVPALLVHGGVKAGGDKHGDAALLTLPGELIDCGGRATAQLFAARSPVRGGGGGGPSDDIDIPDGQE